LNVSDLLSDAPEFIVLQQLLLAMYIFCHSTVSLLFTDCDSFYCHF